MKLGNTILDTAVFHQNETHGGGGTSQHMILYNHVILQICGHYI